MPSLREMIKKLLFPYENILSIAVISDEERNCTLLKTFLCSAFDASDTILKGIGNVTYKRDNDIFCFIVNEITEIKFSIHVFSSIKIDFSMHHILIPVFRLNKYKAHEYDQTAHDSETILSSISSTNKPVIFCYINAQCIFEDIILNNTHWQMVNNELYNRIINNTNESGIKLTEQGNAIIQGLFKVFNYHSREQRLFAISQKATFFAFDNSDSEIVYGNNEFTTNLLMQLLSFDRLNTYHFQIN